MTVPVALFAYARPDLLIRVLNCLRANGVSLLYAFSDGPKTPAAAPLVNDVRDILRAVDWADVKLIERPENLGLGRSIRTGMSQVFEQHPAAIAIEDDLLLAPGAIQFMAAGLEHYASDPRVMSVSAWTHPRVTPSDIGGQPYFDGRAESWSWGTWARVWKGMDRDAASLVRDCRRRKIDVYEYGADLVDMAAQEARRNLWAVRFIYLHILNRGLCLRPPKSYVDHLGVDQRATNASGSVGWTNSSLANDFVLERWPEVRLNRQCAPLWRVALGGRPGPSAVVFRAYGRVKRFARRVVNRASGAG